MLLACLTRRTVHTCSRQFLGWWNKKVSRWCEGQGLCGSVSRRNWNWDRKWLGVGWRMLECDSHRETLCSTRKCSRHRKIHKLQMLEISERRQWARRRGRAKNISGSGERRRQGQVRHNGVTICVDRRRNRSERWIWLDDSSGGRCHGGGGAECSLRACGSAVNGERVWDVKRILSKEGHSINWWKTCATSRLHGGMESPIILAKSKVRDGCPGAWYRNSCSSEWVNLSIYSMKKMFGRTILLPGCVKKVPAAILNWRGRIKKGFDD